jgi:tRNA nucleotidyltransferase (CCA-adding enzyme)
MANIKKILQEQRELIKPSEETLKTIKKVYLEVSKELEGKLKAKKIKAQIFLGGSFAKKTLMKKDKYDIDVFVRFENNKDINKLGGMFGEARKVHGSRDYYELIKENVIIEIVPVLKIKKPENAENVTDLSYFHVNYILKKIRKNKKLADEIRLAKTFCYGQNCYGAESYIQGFSGYALELLICHYKSFLKFIKTIANSKEKEKIIIDDNKFYKNKDEVLRSINQAKAQSPIILVDPTFKQRNASASLSKETFEKFKNSCKKFLKNPSNGFFKPSSIKKKFEKHKDVKTISVKTNKQKGDVAGTKTKKFFKFFMRELKKEFLIKKADFEYDEEKNIGYFYLVIDKKKDEIRKGPHITKVENLANFKKSHPGSYIKNHFAFAKITHNMSFDKWFEDFLKNKKKIIKEMSVVDVREVS